MGVGGDFHNLTKKISRNNDAKNVAECGVIGCLKCVYKNGWEKLRQAECVCVRVSFGARCKRNVTIKTYFLHVFCNREKSAKKCGTKGKGMWNENMEPEFILLYVLVSGPHRKRISYFVNCKS